MVSSSTSSGDDSDTPYDSDSYSSERDSHRVYHRDPTRPYEEDKKKHRRRSKSKSKRDRSDYQQGGPRAVHFDAQHGGGGLAREGEGKGDEVVVPLSE